MEIARIERSTGRIVNIEVADAEWLEQHADDPVYLFEPYVADAPAIVGDTFDPESGFPPADVPDESAWNLGDPPGPA